MKGDACDEHKIKAMSQFVKPDASIIIITFNTRELIKKCLDSLLQETQSQNDEIIVVDNGSEDGTYEFLLANYQHLKILRSDRNLGFAAACNWGFEEAIGRYYVLLNSDAFLHSGSLKKAISLMDHHSKAGIGGGRLIGKDGSWQPSGRLFPSILNEFLQLSGLAFRYRHSFFFGRADRSFAPVEQAAEVDWVPGAFSIIRPEALNRIGYFDERFFLYYEEVDLCKRMKDAGYQVWYWPEILVTHVGGETTKKHTASHLFRNCGAQLVHWRLRSMFLYYRKHYGFVTAWLVMVMEKSWHRLRQWKNYRSDKSKSEDSKQMISLIQLSWKETEGGKISPHRPWC